MTAVAPDLSRPVMEVAEPTPLIVDFETRSRVSLPDVGPWVYASHPSTSILCMGWRLPDGECGVWRPFDAFPIAVARHIAEGLPVEAHNAEFEIAVWFLKGFLECGFPKVPLRQWRDSMARCAAMALPQGLGNAGIALRLGELKSPEGHRLMMRMCKPRKPSIKDPSEWVDDADSFAKLYSYCAQDVAAEWALHEAVPPLKNSEQRLWETHMVINARGIYCDRSGVLAALDCISRAQIEGHARVLDASGGVLQAGDINSHAKVLPWCASRGVLLLDYTKATLLEALSKPLPDDVREVLTVRTSLGKSSTAKYQAMIDHMSEDNRIRGLFNFHGATTGRWAGRGVQSQNLPKGTLTPAQVDECYGDMLLPLDTFRLLWGDPMQALSSCVRGAFCAAPGMVLLAADYKAIEARVVNWLAGQDDIVELFRQGRDLYKIMAGSIFRISADVVDGKQRQLGKKCELACGFGQGADTFFQSCMDDPDFRKAGISITWDQAKAAVDAYRDTHPRVKAFWYALDHAAVGATSAPGTVCAVRDGLIKYRHDGVHLWCRLPSGRRLCYPFARNAERMTPWGEMKMAVHHMAEVGQNRAWMETSVYGGLLAENVTQAFARDIEAHALPLCENNGFPVVSHTHDEVVAEVPESREIPTLLHDFESLICTLPPWAAGCPIAAEGWAGKRYRK